jgi:MFS family permease
MDISKKSALKFVVLLGLVSLLADITYEGARSITGPFLAVLGASATVVGFVAGFGELVGYGLRFISGYIADKTRRYWTITIVGYGVNLIAVPLLALANHWELAAGLIIAERIGKAIRTPSRDAMLSHATKQMGRGWGFGLHEAMDQIGAMLGPLVVAAALYFKEGYRVGFAILLLPALLALAVLFVARYLYPRPSELEIDLPKLKAKKFPTRYWLYLSAVALVAAGYADFPLIAYHFKRVALVSDNLIPVFYSVAMGVDALAALLFGRMFDKIGVGVLAAVSFCSALFAPLVFSASFYLALAGVVLWGIGMGAQESIMRAAVADMVPSQQRGTGYGIFNAGYGIAWFFGSALMGILYDASLVALIIFSLVVQFIAVPLFISVRKK